MNLAETGTRTATSPTTALPVPAAPGIEAWHVASPVVPLIALSFTFEGGAAQDSEGKAGTVQMLGRLLDEGAGDLDSDAFQEALAARAIEQTERPHKAFAPLADDSEAVCLVDDQERIVLDREVEQFAQRGSIPEHREDRLDDDDGARLGAFDELVADRGHVEVRSDGDARLRRRHAAPGRR